MEEYKRICLNPNNNFNCQEIMTYSNRSNYLAANRQNSICRSCTTNESGKGRIPWNKGKKWKMKPGYKNQGETHSRFGCKLSEDHKRKISEFQTGNKSRLGKNHSDETKQKISKTRIDNGIAIGKNNPMFGKLGVDNPNYGKIYGPMVEEIKEKIRLKLIGNKNFLGKKHTEETKRKLRLIRLKQIENQYGQFIPNYNPDSISIIEQYGKEHGYKFHHAENGGEVCIDGYFPDGVDQKQMIIIEIDEKHHFNSDGNLKQKDIDRQKYLESLGYNFIRIHI